MEVPQHAPYGLHDLPLRAAADGSCQGQHERVNDWNSQPREIPIRNVVSEVTKEPFAPPTVKIERRLAQTLVMPKKSEVLLEEFADILRAYVYLGLNDGRLEYRNG